jgi:hypothetical protein
MRLAITLTRNGDTWKVKHLPSVPAADQLAEYKAMKVAGEFGGADEVVIWSNGDVLKRHLKKADKPASVAATQPEEEAPEAAPAPEPKKAKK